MPPVGIIIVTYNSAAEIGACLDAALATESDVIVIDNASTDSTLNEARRRNVRIIANTSNCGFAAAVNQGFAALVNPYVLLLNPDAVIQHGLEALQRACDRPGSGGAGGMLLDRKGSPQTGFMARALPTPAAFILECLLLNRYWPNNSVNRRYRYLGQDYLSSFVVEQPAGAFFMVRRSVWQELGGFDERFYPVWFEDVDFCKRIQQRGLVLYYEPAAVAKHTGGHSVSRLGLEVRRIYWYRSLLRYSAKHFTKGAFRAVCASVMLGALLRSMGESVLSGSLEPLQGYGKVFGFACRSFFSSIRF